MLLGGLALLVAGLALPPRALIERLLPPRGAAYAGMLLGGLWCFKLALAMDGILLACVPILVRLWRRTVEGDWTPPEASAPPVQGTEWGLPLAALLLGLALRLIGSTQSLHGDEPGILQMFIRRGIPVIMTYMPPVTQHVLYSLMAFLTLRLPLPMEMAYRLPGIVFSALAVPLTYLFARRILSRPLAITAALLHAVSIFDIAYAQSSKSYCITECAVLAGLLAAESLRRDWRRTWPWVAFGVVLFTILASHLYNTYLAGGLLLALITTVWHGPRVQRPQAWRVAARLFIMLGATGLVVLSFYALQLPQIVRLAREVAGMPEEHLGPRFFRGWLMQATFWGAAWPAALACLALSAVGAVALAVRAPRIAVQALVPPSAVLTAAWLFDSFIMPRYFVFALPFFLMLCIEGASLPGRLLRRPRVSVACGLAFALAFAGLSAHVLGRYYAVGQQNVRGACHYVFGLAREGEPVLSCGLGAGNFAVYDERVRVVKTVADAIRTADDARQDVYLLCAYTELLRRSGRAAELEGRFQRLRCFDGMLMDTVREDGAVWVLVSRPPRPPTARIDGGPGS